VSVVASHLAKFFKDLAWSSGAEAEDISTIAKGSEKMPQKSTYFYPKLISGLIVNKIDPDEEIQDQKEV
jgi:hypothetical protein